MDVVVPLGGIAFRSAGDAREIGGLVVLVLDQDRDRSTEIERPHSLGEFDYQGRVARVDDGVDRVEAQPIDVELLEPIERVVNDEIANDLRPRPVVVDGVSPGRLVAIREELWRVGRQVIPFGAEVIVDDVEEDGQAVRMGGIDQATQIVRRAVRRIGREQVDSVVTPVPTSGKIRDRHEFDHRHAEGGKVAEFPDDGFERSLRGERADMQLVEHGLGPGTRPPARIRPSEAGRVYDLARTMDVVGLIAGCGIRYREAVRQFEAVARSDTGPCCHEFVPSVRPNVEPQGFGDTLELQHDRVACWRPETEADLTVAQHFGAERHDVADRGDFG